MAISQFLYVISDSDTHWLHRIGVGEWAGLIIKNRMGTLMKGRFSEQSISNGSEDLVYVSEE